MDQVWRRIEAWLAVNAPTIAAGLHPPASAHELAETERFLGVQFPEAVRASYLRHDGQAHDSPWLLEGWEWLSLARIRDEWKVWKDLLDRGDFAGIQSAADGLTVRTDWWNPAWIPLTYSGCGDHHCLDLAPGPRGTPGQIIEMWHDEGSRPVVASGFEAWLTAFANGLETGEFVVSDDYGGICHRDDV
jgi:cell wall assembly regulator SMI1